MNLTPEQLREIALRVFEEHRKTRYLAHHGELTALYFAEFQKLHTSNEEGQTIVIGNSIFQKPQADPDIATKPSVWGEFVDRKWRLKAQQNSRIVELEAEVAKLKAARDYFADQVDRTVLEMGAKCDQLAAKLKALEEQEPVAYLIEDLNGEGVARRAKDVDVNRLIGCNVTNLYAAAPVTSNSDKRDAERYRWWRTTQMNRFQTAYKDEDEFDGCTDAAMKGE